MLNIKGYRSKSGEKDILYIFFTAFILIQCFILLFGESTLGLGGYENIRNYQVAKYSLKHNALFLSHFENLLYTTLLIPFTQLGYQTAKAFNLLIAVYTLIMTAGIVKHLYKKSLAIPIVILSAFSPAYFQMSISLLPEVLFGFILIAAVYLFILERHIWSSLVVSFIPLMAPGGIVILPIFAVAFILKKSYKAIPILLSGIIIYSIAGYLVFDNLLLLFHNFTGGVYQPGDNISYIPFSEIGIFLFLLTAAGMLLWLYEIIKKRWTKDSNPVLFILITGSLVAYYTVSYFVLSKNPVEFTRATAAVVPLMGLISMKTIEFMQKSLKNEKVVAGVLLVIVTAQVFFLFSHEKLLRKATPPEQLIKKAASYLRYNEQESKLFYSDPLLVHYLQIDPCSERLVNSVPDDINPSNIMEWGDVLVWSTQVEYSTAGFKLPELQNDSNLVKIISFTPSGGNKSITNEDYQVHLFKKEKQQQRATEITDYYKSVLSFEKYLDERVKIEDEMMVWELDSSQEYSPAIRLSPGAVTKKDHLDIIVTLHYKAIQPINASEALLVCSIDSEGKSLNYNTAKLITPGNKWEELKLEVTVPGEIPKAGNIVVYVWNKNHKQLLIERITVEQKSY